MNSNANHRLSRQPDLRLKMIPAACRRALATWPRVQRRHITFATSILFGALSCNMAMADLPKICSSGSCGVGVNFYNPANTSISSANASGFTDTGTVDNNNRQIYQLDQLTQNAILNWESFNVDPNVHLYFHNQNYGADSNTLNRIFQANPSNIYGRISGDGRIYLINQNGILFRNGSQVDTHGLIASTLNISDDTFNNGLLTAFKHQSPAFTSFVDAQGNVLPSGGITVENGATITAGKNGAVMLFAPTINQNGGIKTEDGQVILAAGNKIYITASDNTDLRGLVVEVDVTDVSDPQLDAFKLDASPTASLPAGTVTNRGSVEAQRGNISMIGLAINQQGIVHATTAITGNGSIILKARDKVTPVPLGTGAKFSGGNARDGRVTFTSGSHTLVDNDASTATLTASDSEKPQASTIAVAARQIHLEGGSELRAVGGQVELRAQDSRTTLVSQTELGDKYSFADVLIGKQITDNPDQVVADARIQLDTGSHIDVAGDAVNLAMSRNELEVRLTSTELTGEPTQIDGILRGQTVKVDIRDVDQHGRIPIADISAAVNNIAKTVDEHTTQGGTVTLNSQGSLVFAKGASIDVSGGSIAYQDGYVASTKLTASGKVHDIATADPNLLYDGIVGRVIQRSSRWGVTRTWNIGGLSDQATFYRGYVDGQDAGTVNIAAHGMILNGDLHAHTVNGANQRQAADQAKGGQLNIGLAAGIGLTDQKSYRAPNINIGEFDLTQFEQINSQPGLTDSLPQQLANQAYLSTRAFEQGGFNHVQVVSNGVISTQKPVLDQSDPANPTLTLPEGSALHLAPGGTVSLSAAQIRLYGDITSPGGTITVNARDIGDTARDVAAQSASSTVAVDPAVSGSSQLLVGDNVHLSVAGQWTNDREGVAAPIPTDAIVINGGEINLNASQAQTLALGKNVSLDVQGGAWLNATNKLTAGRGGEITVTMGTATDTVNTQAIFAGNLQLQGYALRDGGTLNLTMAGFDISGDSSDASRAAQAAAWGQRQVVQTGVPGTRAALQLPVALFADNGFAAINLTSNQGDIQIRDNSVITAQQQNRLLDSSSANRSSASALPEFSRIDQLAADLRKPVNLQFNIDNQHAISSSATESDRAALHLGNNAAILADAGATIAMSNNSGGAMTIDGRIVTAGGSISLKATHGTNQFFDPNHRITLGEGAVLSTAGTFIPQPNSNGQQRGQVLDGGQVSLSADGYVDAQAGSVIDVSGASGSIDLSNQAGQLVPQTIGSNAGTISLSSHQGIVTNGELIGHAASAQQRGGALNLSLDVDRGGDPVTYQSVYNSYNPLLSSQQLALERTINISQTRSSQALQSGVVNISQQQIHEGGFDHVSFQSTGTLSYADRAGINHTAYAGIHFDGNVDLNMRQGITLDSQRITASDAANVNLTAPYIQLGDPQATVLLDPATVATPTAQATITADLLDIVGYSSWQGFEQLILQSHGDIRFTNPNISNYGIPGGLATTAQLTLVADQLYPTTLYDFRLASAFQPTLEHPDSIYIGHNAGANPSVPLSVGGQLTLDGAAITIDGTVRAPLGELLLGTDTTQRVTVTAHGVVGTSLDGANVLFGRISNSQWYYQLGGVSDVVNGPLTQLPQQQITIKGTTVDLQAGSTVDVKGGGDLLAWDYVPIGKLYDPLAAANAGNYFAILPAQAGIYAPYDPQEFAGWSIQPGDSVYLSGGGGIAAGTYAILPARYALLPGAMLVQELPTQRDRPLGTTGALSDGTPVVAGYHTQLNTGYAESRTRSFAVHPGSYAYRLAEFSLTRASDYLLANAVVQRTPLDAGTLTFTPQNTLALNGQLDFAPASGGRGVEVNIDSANLQVVAQRGPEIAGQVQLVASELNGLNAESILLGGTRTHGSTNELQIHTNNLTLADGAVLQGPEWILAARQNLAIGDNVIVNATASNATAQGGVWHSDANSAFIRLSAGDQMTLLRDGQPSGAPTISIGTGTRLQADHAILVDAGASSSALNLQGRLHFNPATDNHQLSISANTISLDDAVPNQAGIHLSSQELTGSALDNLTLRGRQQIGLGESSDLYAHRLQIDTAALRGSGAAATTAKLRGDQILFTPSGNVAATGSATGQGTLEVSATTISLGNATQLEQQQFSIDGFNRIDVSASGDILAAGKTVLTSSGDMNLASARFTAQSGADLTLNAANHKVSFSGNANTGTLPANEQLGARLQVQAADIAVAGRIELHSGIVDLHTDGNATGQGVSLGDNAAIDVSGIDKSFAELIRGTPGGTVKLTAVHGAVQTASTSMINVSGADSGGDAGLLSVSAISGNTQLQGELSGTAAPGYSSGRFQLDTQTLSGTYSDLNTQLTSGGFHGERTLRLRGDSTAVDTAVNTITIAAGDTVKANYVKFVADQGGIVIQGHIDASGANGGDITLMARDDVTLAAAASLDAHATAVGGNGGDVIMDSQNGGMYLDGAVNVSRGASDPLTGKQGRAGQVKLRLQRDALLTLTDADSANNKLRINNALMQADYLQIEGTKSYTAGTNTTIDPLWNSEAGGFMANAGTIQTALGDLASRTDLHLRAGIELQSAGDLTLNTPWDVSASRPGAEPINLTLRAAGNLTINQSLSDGFVGSTNVLLDQRSADMTLVGGADMTSADRTVVKYVDPASTTGNVTIGANTTVRTGTGDITVAAGNDIKLSQITSTIYTAGRGNALALDYAEQGSNAMKALPSQGGDLTLYAGDRIIGPGSISDSRQLFTEWLNRQAYIAAVTSRSGTTPAKNAGWWINYGGFQQNFAAFGGGDITANAGGDIYRASFSAPTTGYYDLQSQQEVHIGNGNLTVHAGGDIISSIFFVGDGTGRITSDSSLTDSGHTASNQQPLGTVFAVMGGSLRTQARSDIKVSLLVNPTLLKTLDNFGTYFFTYSPASVAAFNALAGSIYLQTGDYNYGFSNIADTAAGEYLPGNLMLEADGGSIEMMANTKLFPSAMSQLNLLADGSINTGFTISNTSPDIIWDIRRVATSNLTSADGIASGRPSEAPDQRAIPPLHLEDREPVWLVANQGDVNLAYVSSPKALRISAGRDLRLNSKLYTTHAQQDQITQLSAGRDILFTDQGSELTVYGPGQLLLDAGRNVDLGVGKGVLSQGDLRYPELPGNGANITVLAGLSGVVPQYSQFMLTYSHYLANGNPTRDRFLANMQQRQGNSQLTVAEAFAEYLTLTPRAQAEVRTASGVSAKELFDIEAVEQFQRQSTVYLQDLRNDASLTREQALTDISNLPLEQQRPLILQAFFAELRTAGRIYNLPDASAEDKNYAGGYRALEALFPGSSVRTSNYHGDVNLFFSQIKTEDGGDINILVPGGIVNAGLAVQPPNAPEKAASDLGIVAAREGSIRIYTHDDLQVNQSRIFTLGGGDILLWSSYGDIDAGRGAKSAVSAPPPQLVVANDGSVSLDFAGAVSGSGIRVICTTNCNDKGGFISIIQDKGPGIKYSAADVDLIAPHGTVSAGEAGIGSAGNLFIAAQQVLGTDNIDIGGVSFGVPSTTPTVTPPTISSPETTGIKTGGIKPTEYQPIGDGNTLMYLDVEVVGFGEQDENEKRKKKQ